MEDIGNYLYIIFLIIIFLANTFFGKKKKQEQRKDMERTEPVGEQPTFEEILEDVFGKKKSSAEDKPDVKPMARPVKPVEETYKTMRPVRENVEKTVRKTKEKVSDIKKELKEEKQYVNEFQRYMEDVKGKDRKSSIIRDQAALQIIELGEEGEKFDLELDTFDMRKAIVYNTILERKYT